MNTNENKADYNVSLLKLKIQLVSCYSTPSQPQRLYQGKTHVGKSQVGPSVYDRYHFRFEEGYAKMKLNELGGKKV